MSEKFPVCSLLIVVFWMLRACGCLVLVGGEGGGGGGSGASTNMCIQGTFSSENLRVSDCFPHSAMKIWKR